MTERWLPVVGYEGSYEVSDQGRVRSLDRVVVSKTGVSRCYKGRVLTACNSHGYQCVVLSPGSNRLVHRLVLEAFVGPPPDGKPYALHSDGDPDNNRLGNLRWGSQFDNMADMREHGRQWQSKIMECPRGHAYDEQNTLKRSDGGRKCRACDILRHREKVLKGLPVGDPRHGTRNGYSSFGCRCGPCKTAQGEYYLARKEKKLSQPEMIPGKYDKKENNEND